MKRPLNWALVGGVIVIAAIALSFLGDTDESEQAAAPTAGVQVPPARTAPPPAPPPAPTAQTPPPAPAAPPAATAPPAQTTPPAETASSSETAPPAQTAPPAPAAAPAETAPPARIAPPAQPAPTAPTAPAPETAAAEPAKPSPDMARIKPQGEKDEGEQAAAPPAAVPAPAPPAPTAPAPQTAPPPQTAPAPQTAPPSRTATAPQTAPPAQTAPAPRTAPPARTAAAEPAKPSFDIVRINPQGDTVMAGRAEPGARVQILDGGKVIGEATADARGEWVFVPDKPLPPGDRLLSLRTVGTGGRPAATSDSEVVLVVPEKGKDIAGRPSEEPSQPLALKVPSEGGGATQVLQKPTPPAPAPDPAPLAVTIDAVDYDDGGRLNVSGTGTPDGQVHLYLNNEFLGRSQAGADGRWRQSPERTVAPGVYSVRADQVDDAGKVLARIEVVFARSTLLGDVPPGTLVVVQPGNSLWRIARRTYGRGVRFTVIFEANRKQIRDADLIYPGQVFRLPSIN